MSAPKVAVYLPSFLNFSETFIYQLIKNMKEHEPVVFCKERKNAEQFPWAKVYTGSQVTNRSNFKKILKAENIRLIHAQFGISGAELLKIKAELNLPLITHFRGQDGYQLPNNLLIRYLSYRPLFQQGDLFLTVSEHLKKELIKLGCAEQKIRVYYGGINLQEFPYISRQFTKKDQYQLIMCGRLVEKKGYEFGLKAVAELMKQGYDLKLKIIGDGPLLNDLQKLTRKLFITNEVSFLGKVDYAGIKQELTQADALLAPYRTARNGDREGIPNIIKEAMAVGLPVLTTDHSGIPELMQDGLSGYLAKENDENSLVQTVKRYLDDPVTAQQICAAARRTIEEKFDLVKQVSELEKIYNEFISKL